MTNVFSNTYILSLSIRFPTFVQKNFSYNIFVPEPIYANPINHSVNTLYIVYLPKHGFFFL